MHSTCEAVVRQVESYERRCVDIDLLLSVSGTCGCSAGPWVPRTLGICPSRHHFSHGRRRFAQVRVVALWEALSSVGQCEALHFAKVDRM